MRAQKIALGVLGSIALVLLMIVLSIIGGLSSIADRRASNAAKISTLEQQQGDSASLWSSLNDKLNEKQAEYLSYAAMERADGRLQESADQLESRIEELKKEIAEQSAAIAKDEEILKYLQRLAEESSISAEEIEALSRAADEEGRE